MKLNYNQVSYDIASFIAMKPNESWLRDLVDFVAFWVDDDSDTLEVQTSGSTGNPKLIALSKDAMRISAGITNRFFELDTTKTALLCLPAKFIAGKMMLVRAIEADMDLWIEAPSAHPLANLDQEIDFVAMTPFQLELVLNTHSSRLDFIQTILLGGGPASPQLVDKLQDISARCFLSYGMTETITHIALKPLNGKDKSNHFQVLEGFEISVDERGCLIIEADHIYEQKVITNDIVSLLGSKAFLWKGRHDHIINTGGIKINPEVVENKVQDLIDYPFFIIGTPDQQLGEKVTLCLELEDKTALDHQALLKKIESRLSKFENPRSILFFDCFLYTATGKIKRRQTLETHC